MPDWLPRDIIAPASDAEHEAVKTAQRALKLSPTGEMDESTKASLRGVQRLFRVPVTGILDRETGALIERLAHIYREPE
jgi:peptidoglycan hydrolase-like protein with peptidoglycan-binding domain